MTWRWHVELRIVISSWYSLKGGSIKGNKKQNMLIKTGRVSICFGLSDTLIFERNDLPSIRWDGNIVTVSESHSLSFAIDAQVRNCDGVVLKILMDCIFQWPYEGLSCEPLTCIAVTWALRL